MLFTFGQLLPPSMDSAQVQVSFSPGQFLSVIATPVALVLGLGALVCVAATGRAGLGSALRFVLGRGQAAERVRAARALQAWSRGTLGAGLVMGLACAASLLGIAEASAAHPAPAKVAEGIHWVLLAPFCGLALGRIALGSLAEGAELEAGLDSTSSPGADLGLLFFAAFPLLVFFVATY